MIKTLIEGLVLGLTTGTTCLATCSPIYLPWLISENRSLKNSLIKVGEISIGRFISYILFGAVAGYFGGKISQINREWFTGISYIFLSVFLIINAFRTQKHEKKCIIPKWTKLSSSALILGLITGINFCPSFLIALSKSIELAGVSSGILLFTGFFVGTTAFLVPLAFTSLFTSLPTIKLIARYSSVLVAIWFLYQGIINLNHTFSHYKTSENSQIIELTQPNTKVVYVTSDLNQQETQAFSDSLKSIYADQFEIANSTILKSDQLNPAFIYIINEDIPLMSDSLKYNILRLSRTTMPQQLSDFIRNTSFKVSEDKKIYWKI